MMYNTLPWIQRQMKPILSIVIPTFNRSQICKRQIRHVATWRDKNQMNDLVDICVLDNASEEQQSLILKQECEETNVCYKYNHANVGFSGNFCRSVQVGEGDYIWVISDDDFVSETCMNMVLKYLKSENKPGIIGFSVEMRKPILSGKIKNVISDLIENDLLSITSLTLVTSTIFARKNFDYDIFWENEPYWFPHTVSIYKTAMLRNEDCVLIRSRKGLIQESGNTSIERQTKSQSPYVIGLNREFQSALLYFINQLAVLIGKNKITESAYIDIVCERFKCQKEFVAQGFGKIEGLRSK